MPSLDLFSFLSPDRSSVEIRYEQGRGRFAVAREDIPMGTTVMHEQPITYSLYPEK